MQMMDCRTEISPLWQHHKVAFEVKVVVRHVNKCSFHNEEGAFGVDGLVILPGAVHKLFRSPQTPTASRPGSAPTGGDKSTQPS